MTVTLPETLQYGYVKGRYILAIGDKPEDADSLPNAIPAVGTITFSPALLVSKETTVDPPTTVIRTTINCTLDSTGRLTDPAGANGVYLITGVYKVSYNLTGVTIASHDILVTSEHTAQNPLDLTLAAPSSTVVVTPSQYAELSARIDSIDTGGSGSAVVNATTDVAGISELATPEETIAGTDLIRVVTPAGMKAALDAKAVSDLSTFEAKRGADDNYVTDAEKTALHSHANKSALDQVSGVNTGDQDLSGLVPNTRTVNGKPLSANVTLNASDVGAATPQQVTDGDTATLSAAQSHAQGLVNALTAASPATLDTLAEIANALGEDPNFAATMTAALAARVRFDAAQSLTVGEQAQARSNIGAGTSSFSGAYSDLSSKPTLGDAAAKNTGTTAGTVAAGDDSRITGAAQKSANLSDLANAGTARTNLGLGTAATAETTDFATITQPINAQTGAYTLVASDAGKMVKMTLAAAADLTVPANVFAAGQRVDIADRGTARVTVVAGSGMTINPPAGGSLVMEGQYSAASLFFWSATEADLIGLVAAS